MQEGPPEYDELEEVKAQLKQETINFKWILNNVEIMHNVLCPNHVGTWQDRVKEVIKIIKKL